MMTMGHLRRRRVLWALAALLGLVVVGMLGTVPSVRAIEFDDDGVIAADEVVDDDVLISGDNVVVDGMVKGNLISSGGHMTINGMVSGDLFVSGGKTVVNGVVDGSVAFMGKALVVNGEVRGSVYMLGASLELAPSATVGRNVLFNGYSMETMAGSVIERDILATGYQALLAGRVDRDVHAEVGALEIKGIVERDVMAEVSEPRKGPPMPFWPDIPAAVDTGLRVAKEAQIGGALTYQSPVDQASAIEATPGGGVFFQLSGEPEASASFRVRARKWVLARLRELVTLLVLGGLAVWRLPALLDRLADQARTKPLPAVGWGLVATIVGYVGPFILAALVIVLGGLLGVVTLGGLAGAVFGVGLSGLALVFVLFLLVVSYGSKLVVVYLVGRSVLRRAVPEGASPIWPMILGIFLYIPLRSIPLLGWLIGVLATFVGLGAMWMLWREGRSARAPVAGQGEGAAA